MKKQLPNKLPTLFACLSLLLFAFGANAQALTGIKTVPGDYPSITAAVAALNSNGVGAGGVTINVAAGYTETISSTIVLTASGTQANPIVFQKNGAGVNPRITSYEGSADATASTPDGIWALSGSDYVTIDGIDLLDDAANTTALTTMEYGYGLFKASESNGCQHNTIQNCEVSLSVANNTTWSFGNFGSIGIAVFNSKYDNANVHLLISAASGSNSFNRFYSNTIQNCNAGIAFNGFAAPAPTFALGDTLNDVGGSSLSTGNSILNFGGAPSGTNPASGISAKDQWGLNVSYNTINNTGSVNHSGILRGIWLVGAGGTNSFGASVTCRYNTISVKSGTPSTSALYGIECAFGGTYAAENTIDISHNTFTGCSYKGAASPNMYMVFLSGGTSKYIKVNYNTFTEDTVANTGGTVILIQNAAVSNGGVIQIDSNVCNGIRILAPGTGTAFSGINSGSTSPNATVNIRGNSFSQITQASLSSGAFSLITTAGSLSNGTYNILNNTFNDLTINTSSVQSFLMNNTSATAYVNIVNNTGADITRLGAGTFYLISNNNASTTPVGKSYVYNNSFSNITLGAFATNFYGIFCTKLSHQQIIRKNTISQVNGPATGFAYGIDYNRGDQGSIVDSNTITNISTAGTVYGINTQTNVVASSVAIANNRFDKLSSTGAFTVYGMNFTSGANSTFNVYNNRIDSLTNSNAGGTVYGINNAITTIGNTVNLYNNLISNLATPAATTAVAVPNQSVGINSTTSTGNFNIYNNTVLLSGTSSGANFGSSALSVNVGATLDLRNNILINLCTPKGTGRTVVFRRSGVSLATLAATTNNNILYAGDSTIAFRHLFNDGTNVDTLLSAYKVRMDVRETNSQTENTVFLSTTGTNPDFLKIDPSVFSYAESGGTRLATIPYDANGLPRASFAGYNGTGGLPDIGGVEGNYLGNIDNQMTLVSQDAVQISKVAAAGSVNNRILRLEVTTEKAYNALTVSSFQFNTIGTSADSNIVNAKIYYTGVDSNFATTDLFGTAPAPSGVFHIPGTQALASGTNYFWLTYDIASNASAGNLLDAQADEIVINGTGLFFNISSPSGNSTVGVPLNSADHGGPYTVGASGSEDYIHITDALNDLYLLGVSGPVTFLLKDTAYNSGTGETFPLVLSDYQGRSAVNTVTIMPDVLTPSYSCRISTSEAAPVFSFDNGQYFVIDGSQGGSESFVPGSNLRIMGMNVGQPTIEIKNESSNNIIKYADISGRNTTLASQTLFTAAGIVSFQGTTGASGNDNNILHGCDIHADSLVTPPVCVYSWGSWITDVANNNDGNIIDSCNIYDYFLSSATPSAGIYIAQNNNAWQIINNRLFQTASRTWQATGQTHRGIWVYTNSTSNPFTFGGGFVVNNNQIGGDNPLGTGLYTMLPGSGTVGHFFSGIELTVGVGSPTTVQGNTVANISTTSNSASAIANMPICLRGGTFECSGNMIRGITHITGNQAGGGITGIMVQNLGSYNVYNNTIKEITVAGVAPNHLGEFVGIHLLTVGAANIQNNIIGDTLVANSINNTCTATGNQSFAPHMLGIYLTQGSAAGTLMNIKVDNNIIANMSSDYNGRYNAINRYYMKGIAMAPAATGVFAVTNNRIFKLTTANKATNTGGFASLGGIVVNSAALTGVNSYTVSNNSIHSLTLTNDTTAAMPVQAVGMYINTTGVGENIVSGNMVHSISKQSSNDAERITGIQVVGGNPSVINNVVRLGIDSTGTSISVPMTFNGIVDSVSTAGIYFNTVYIGGNNVGSSGNRTFAFMHKGTGTNNVLNNIFVNKRSGLSGGAGHFAVSLDNNTNLTQNFNILFADSIGVFDNDPQALINNWKVTSAVDANSLWEDPKLLNPEGNVLTMNLAIDSTEATPIEGYGQAISAIGADVDFNGRNRAALTPVDLGAYAGNFIALDVAPPLIAYTALESDTITTDRTVTATITDATGVLVAPASAPRIYFRKASESNFHNAAGTRISGTAQSGTWSFVISQSAMGGVTGDDSVYYFIVAQDSTPAHYLGSTPGGAEGTDVGNITVFPATNNYRILPILNGILNVGDGQTLPNLTGENGAFNYLNTSYLGGDVTLSITSDIIEPGTFALSPWKEAGDGNYRVRIVPSVDSLRNITGAHRMAPALTEALIRINGADRLTIDGSYNGTGRYLRFLNRDSLGGTISLFNDADGDTIANCILEGITKSASTPIGVLNIFGTNVVGGTGNDSNVVIGCIFQDTTGSLYNYPWSLKPFIGIISTPGLVGNDYNQVVDCDFVNIRSTAIQLHTGIGGSNYWTIYNNAFYQINDSIVGAYNGILISSGGGSVIRKNSFGGSSRSREGAPMTMYTGSNFRLINNMSTATTLPFYIDSNEFGNMNLVGGALTQGQVALIYNGATNAPLYCRYNKIGGTANAWDTIAHNNTCQAIYTTQSGEIAYNTIGRIYKRGTGGSGGGQTTGITVFTANPNLSIHDNYIYDLLHSFTTWNTTGFLGPQGAGGIYMLPSQNMNLTVERNILDNIGGINGGLVGKGIFFNANGLTGTLRINANKISNMYSDAPGGYGAGILTSTPMPSGSVISNNQISLRGNGKGCLYGYVYYGTVAGVNDFINNTIFINGVADTSYGIIMRNSASVRVNAHNNIIYNKCVPNTGLGHNMAIATEYANLSQIKSFVQNNLMIVNDTARLIEDSSATAAKANVYGWHSMNSVYTTTIANRNWAANVDDVPADSLFKDTLTGDLDIVAEHSHAWYANGKGVAQARVAGDYNSQSDIRSISVATGASDIGADEFTPTGTPPAAYADKNPVPGDSTQFFFGSRMIGKLNWDFGGVLPSSVNAYYYSGVDAPNLIGGRTKTNAYWVFQPADGDGQSGAMVTLMIDSANLGTVGNASDVNVARYTGTEWVRDSSGTLHPDGTFTSGDYFTGHLGVFTGTDGSNNPLPVKLTTFAATAQQGDVLVDWSTASETNNRGFEVERSLDGRSFESVGFVKGAGNSSRTLNYAYNDKGAFAQAGAQVLYYRLKQVDMNGNSNYSQIAKVSMDSKEANGVSAYPNPFSNELQLSFRSANEGSANVRILNIQGMVVAEQNKPVTSGINRIELDGLSQLHTGLYFVQLTVNGETTVVKMMKD